MKRFLKFLIPFLLCIGILVSIAWYLLVYDREFTRDVLISQARFFDSNGNAKFASMLYDWAYDYTGQSDDVAIELAQQYKADGNYTKAEYTLTNAIADGATVDLYVALCKTFVQQDKLLDAVNMLDSIGDPAIKAKLDAMRPQAPAGDPEPGYYTQYFSVSLRSDKGEIYYTTDGLYPTMKAAPFAEPLPLSGGETIIHAISVDSTGLVSPLSILNYTIGGVIEPAVFTDPAIELAVREKLGAEEDSILMTDMLWSITDFTVPDAAGSLDDLALMPYLEVLRVPNFNLESLDFLSSLQSLRELDLTGCRFPADQLAALAELPELRKLSLAGCGLSTIADLEGTNRLTSLDLSSNTLRNLEVLTSMTGLTELYLQHNAVTSLDSLGEIPSLEKLDISFNSVKDLQPLGTCTKLAWLNAGNNLLTSLKGLDALPVLSHLDADHNSLSRISELSNCMELAELNLSNNSLTSLSALENHTKLVTLNVSYNALTEFPYWPDGSVLATIDASYNKITSVYPLHNLEELTYVYVDYNQLTTVDPIADCFRLVMVNAYGNEIEDVSKLTDHNIIVNYDPT